MGSGNSKIDRDEALCLCKARKDFVRQAVESRCALASAHWCYVQSLRSFGIALRRYAESELLMGSSLSTSATDLDRTPSHSSCPSPTTPPGAADLVMSPFNSRSPVSQPKTRMSFMRYGSAASVTVSFSPSCKTGYLDCDDSVDFVLPPPPPLPPEPGTPWDFFEPVDDAEGFRSMSPVGLGMDFEKLRESLRLQDKGADDSEVILDKSDVFHDAASVFKFSAQQCPKAADLSCRSRIDQSVALVSSEAGHQLGTECREDAPVNSLQRAHSNSEKERPLLATQFCTDREDPSEFITHRAKDFLSSIKDIEHKFFKVSESGKEVSRMLEGNKVRVGYPEEKGHPSPTTMLAAFQHVCCRKKPTITYSVPGDVGAKLILWKRSCSSRSSSSRNPLTTGPKDDASDSGSDFVDEACMISGSHSSTLERLFAWERKLYDEVKASELIRKEYDKKCDQLKRQFAKGCTGPDIDKTRVVAKDLHSRVIVALHSVDLISKRIEKMRDEEILPQLMELVQGLIRMWKSMLECHHAQYITISLAYHSEGPSVAPSSEVQRRIMDQLHSEIEQFGLCFANWTNSLTSYVESLNGWLQHCIVLPPERSKHRRPWSPRRLVAPPIFSLCREWSAGLKALPSTELSDAIRDFFSDLYDLKEQQLQLLKKHKPVEGGDGGAERNKDNDDKDCVASNLSCMQTSLTKVLDRLTKFSEASLKMYEDVRLKCEAARVTYSRPVRSRTRTT
ncbi:hypothetical protein MLD38_008072 [Melastoma candidum]|uniref:Uncharacterized protein n=1 Tax=Melastoma candidum TaxID=119954 RepID=A0ACB9RT31_9MYRT|nr:hypothetical protein MLD38_008072 [Melastoma candidum]